MFLLSCLMLDWETLWSVCNTMLIHFKSENIVHQDITYIKIAWHKTLIVCGGAVPEYSCCTLLCQFRLQTAGTHAHIHTHLSILVPPFTAVLLTDHLQGHVGSMRVAHNDDSNCLPNCHTLSHTLSEQWGRSVQALLYCTPQGLPSIEKQQP